MVFIQAQILYSMRVDYIYLQVTIKLTLHFWLQAMPNNLHQLGGRGVDLQVPEIWKLKLCIACVLKVLSAQLKLLK
jgi:hypothetical protein